MFQQLFLMQCILYTIGGCNIKGVQPSETSTPKGSATGEAPIAGDSIAAPVVSNRGGGGGKSCRIGYTLCSDECVNTQTDSINCGACGTVCNQAYANSTATCSNGTCGYDCLNGFADCDTLANNGCEVSIASDSDNCGGCAGLDGVVCSGTATPDCCSGSCVDLSTAESTCGGCGAQCDAGNCVAGTCETSFGSTCNTGYAHCSTDVADHCETRVIDWQPSSEDFSHSVDNTLTLVGNVSGPSHLDFCTYGSTGSEVIYAFTPPTTAYYTFNAQSSTFDVVIAVRSGSCSGTQVLCNDDNDGLAISLTQGTTVYVVVDQYQPNVNDSFTLKVTRGDAGSIGCPTGYGNCDAVADNGCEANVGGIIQSQCGSGCLAPGVGELCIQGEIESLCNTVTDHMCGADNTCSTPTDQKCGGCTGCTANQYCRASDHTCQNETAKTVFLSSGQYKSNLGFHGIAGADALCQRLADKQAATTSNPLLKSRLEGRIFRAWLSSSTSDIKNRLGLNGSSLLPYQMVDGTDVAADGTTSGPHGLLSTGTGGTLLHPINISESSIDMSRAAAYPYAWSGTDADGTVDDQGQTCADWTSTTEDIDGAHPDGAHPEYRGMGGILGSLDGNWTHNAFGGCVTFSLFLYCIEQ